VSATEPVSLPPAPRRSSALLTTLIAAIVVLLAFGSGILVGFFADRYVIFHHGMHVPPFATHMMMRRLDRRLDLTHEQRAQIQQIIERHATRMETELAAMRPRVNAEIRATNEEIAAVLTPEQRAKFDKFKLRPGPYGGMRPRTE
jgi:Spy/CpxP family protein refolding chaperone